MGEHSMSKVIHFISVIIVTIIKITILPLMYLYFRYIQRWKIIGDLPKVPKMVAALAPHTSDFDFVFLLMLSVHFRRWPSWLGKRELFEPALVGPLLYAVGGIPVDRDAPLKATKQTIAHMEKQDEIILAIAPDGTRQYTDHWKKGFYFIAHKMKLPIVFIALDYATKTITLREAFYTTGDAEKDLETIRPFFEGVQGRVPENASRIQFE
jgi:1-acyl-sn-glycerol-3-phosphate acyltransferase